MARVVHETLHPLEVVSRAGNMTRSDFVGSFGTELLLLVCLDGQPESLLQALIECPTDPSRPWYPRSETTGTQTSLGRDYTIDELKRIASQPPKFDGSSLRELLDKNHFVVPLHKRAQAQITESERISVGRSRTNDIVVFHSTVSKFHAWLEYDDRGRVYVCDAHSTNFTRVGGRIIDSDEVLRVPLGAELRFGDVYTRVCATGTLWDALKLDDPD